MNEQIRQRWCDALCDGSYIQTHIDLSRQAVGILRNVSNEGYSTIGVLMDLFVDYRFDMRNPIFWTNNLIRLPQRFTLVRDYLETMGFTAHQQIALISMYEIPRRPFNEAAEFIASDFRFSWFSNDTLPNVSHILV